MQADDRLTRTLVDIVHSESSCCAESRLKWEGPVERVLSRNHDRTIIGRAIGRGCLVGCLRTRRLSRLVIHPCGPAPRQVTSGQSRRSRRQLPLPQRDAWNRQISLFYSRSVRAGFTWTSARRKSIRGRRGHTVRELVRLADLRSVWAGGHRRRTPTCRGDLSSCAFSPTPWLASTFPSPTVRQEGRPARMASGISAKFLTSKFVEIAFFPSRLPYADTGTQLYRRAPGPSESERNATQSLARHRVQYLRGH